MPRQIGQGSRGRLIVFRYEVGPRVGVWGCVRDEHARLFAVRPIYGSCPQMWIVGDE